MKSFITSLLMIIPLLSSAQTLLRPDYRHFVARPALPDTADVVHLRHKAFWRAAAETVGTNLSLWSFDRFVQKGQYSYISFNTIKENFRHGFEWDNDYLGTNMFAHPYNGSIYYNAGRSNGFNFWQSELFAIGGSAMWEMFMEREYPSTNDIIATPIGGAAIGEVLYRTADVILNDRATGAERFGRELAAFIVDPMRGFTRLITGRAWRHRSTRGRKFGTPAVTVDLSVGSRYLTMLSEGGGSSFGGAFEVNLHYGDRFATSSRMPYDYFSFILELNAMKSQPLLSRVEIIGRLLSREIVDRDGIKASIGLYQHFDYFDSDTIAGRHADSNPLTPCAVPYKFGTPASLGGGVMAQFHTRRNIVVDTYAHANAVVLAGTLTDFYRKYHRNYNWGLGYSIKAGVNVVMPRSRFVFSVADQFYKIFTWNGYDQNFDWSTTPEGAPVNIQGDASRGTFNHFELSVNYRLFHRLYLTGGLDLYNRRTQYDFPIYLTPTPTVYSQQLGTHLMLTYGF